MILSVLRSLGSAQLHPDVKYGTGAAPKRTVIMIILMVLNAAAITVAAELSLHSGVLFYHIIFESKSLSAIRMAAS